MSGLKIRTEFKNEQLPFSFTTELEGDKLICTIESPKEDQKYACYLLYQKGGNLTAFYKEWYSPNKRREFDLSALLSESDLPAFIAVRVFVGDKDLTIMHSVQSESFYYPLPTGPKVSVVISVHNAEEYLEETFRSVSEQKYLNAEFIFVDMGSKDRSLELLRDFMKSEPRAMLLRERGKFPSNAWDAGMEKASGDYIIFLEAGDTFSPCLLCDTVACAEETCADIVVFSTERFDASKETAPVFEALDPAKTPSDTRAFFGKSGLTDIFAFTGPVLFNKLFRREFLSSHDLLFDPHISMADEVFTYTALALAKKIAPVYKVLLTRRGGGEDETSNDRSLYPLSFLSLPFELKKTLTDKGVYEEIEASFLSFALSYV
ncbi:MAG: glycosyltransferase family 2 protein, partial [Clostridia bacterium]|nr:glycosyltransferase family 2 protein [Clostridia bacterium]